MIPETSLQENWKWLMDLWVAEDRKAKETGDYGSYIEFLQLIKKELSKVYIRMTNEVWIEFIGSVLQTTTCKLKESIIKSKNSMAEVKKSISEMSNEELLTAYKVGSTWLSERQQITGTDKNELGQPYNNEEWQRGLKRLEQLEAEIQKRGLAI